MDFIFYDTKTRSRKILTIYNSSYIVEVPFSDVFYTDDANCNGNAEYNKIPIPTEHSSAFIDLDADCMNDLVINSSGYIEIWKGYLDTTDNKIKYCLNRNNAYKIYDDNLGFFTVADINRDGKLDLVFPILNSSEIFVIINKLSLKVTWSEDFCGNHPSDITQSQNAIFDEINLNKNSTV